MVGGRYLNVLVVLFAFGWPVDCHSENRTAFMFREDDRALVSVQIPSPNNNYINPTVITTFDWFPLGSTLDRDGRILSIKAATNELVAVNTSTGGVEVLTVLSENLSGARGDLFWGIDDELFCTVLIPSGSEVYRIDPNTGLMSQIATVAPRLTMVTTSGGQYFGWDDNRSLFGIDPETFEATLLHEIPGGSTLPWGLTSSDGTLWTGLVSYTTPPNEFPSVFRIDPIGGGEFQFVEFGKLVGTYTALEITEQPSPTSVPDLQLIGTGILILAIFVAGIQRIRVA